MDGATLEALDKPALIELISRLQAEHAAAIAVLRREVDELRARLGQDSNTSSRPPSSDPPKAQAQRRAPPSSAGGPGERRRGGQPGHSGHHRPLLGEERVDRVVAVSPAACRGCGAALPSGPGAGEPSDERVQVVELPPVRAEVTEYRLAARRCAVRGALTRAARPAEASGGAFGPRLQAVAALLVGRYRLSRPEAVACLGELGEAELSVGALVRLEQATSAALGPVVDGVAEAVRHAAAANLDETGWWQGKQRSWLWTAVTEALTLFRLDRSRSRARVMWDS